MIHRFLAVLGVATAIAAQTPSPKAKPTTPSAAKVAKGWTVPRTPDGQPDLQGIWTNASLTPFDRPDQFAGKEFFTEEEAAEQVQIRDRQRAEFIATHFHRNLGDVHQYDMVLNTSRLGEQQCADVIAHAARAKAAALTPEMDS